MLTRDETPGGGGESSPCSPQDTHRCALSRGGSAGTAWVRPPPPLARNDSSIQERWRVGTAPSLSRGRGSRAAAAQLATVPPARCGTLR